MTDDFFGSDDLADADADDDADVSETTIVYKELTNVVTNTEIEDVEVGYKAKCACDPLRTFDQAGTKLIVNENAPMTDLPDIGRYTRNQQILDLMTDLSGHPNRVRIYKLQTPGVYRIRPGREHMVKL